VTSESVTLSISDDGPGFATVVTESPAQVAGHGIGLPLARRLIEASHGRLVLAHTGPRPVIDVVLLRAPVDLA
jgi:signal transduction histidine kinase